jgi:1-acyl-sn-glycerol-3-phosphate acyltransferase
MLYLRSFTFNALLYLKTIVEMIVFTPFYFLAPRKTAWVVPKFWARGNLWLQKVIAGTDTEIHGLENLPEGSYIVAPKHQSFWDTFAFIPLLPDPVYILKRELTWIPLFGWYVLKMRMIPIKRGSRGKALKEVVRIAHERMAEGRQLIIYPEGTRRPPGAPPAYKYGIVELYAQLGLPVVVIAHNAGLYWPRRRFLRYPGTIRARILPPIPPGLDRDTFFARLVETTETACDELLMEAACAPNPPPLPPTARERLRQLGLRTGPLAALREG